MKLTSKLGFVFLLVAFSITSFAQKQDRQKDAAKPAAAAPTSAAPSSAPAASPSQISEKLYEGMRYRLVGPFRGGRVLAVAGDPKNPRTYYFGAVSGGVW